MDIPETSAATGCPGNGTLIDLNQRMIDDGHADSM